MPQRKQKKVVKKKVTSSRSSAKTASHSRKTLKTTKKVSLKRNAARAQRLKNIRERFDGWKWTESYNSFLLGIVVVIVAVLFVASFIKQSNKIQDTSSLATVSPTAAPTPTPGSTYTEGDKTYYVVKADDSLWNIAEQIYNDGYKWTDIAKANNLANPGTIFKGDKLVIPNAPTPSTLGQINQEQNPQSNAITGNSYTVQKGDDLWSIAVRAYADGYQWVKIARANNLANPDTIFSGNVLTLPR